MNTPSDKALITLFILQYIVYEGYSCCHIAMVSFFIFPQFVLFLLCFKGKHPPPPAFKEKKNDQLKNVFFGGS